MAFNIKRPASFKWPVEVNLPADGGRYKKDTFTAEFINLSTDEVDDFAKLTTENDKTLAEKVGRIMTGWSGIVDDSGEVPFSDKALDEALKIPGVANAIIMAYSDAIMGNGARRKN